MKNKIKSTLDSRNFFVNLLSLVFYVLALNGAEVNAGAGESIVDAFQTKEVFAIIAALVPNLINPIMKIAKNGFSFAFLKSKNFWVQFTNLALGTLVYFGLQFPEGAASEILEIVFNGDWGALITAISINILTPLYYFFFKKE